MAFIIGLIKIITYCVEIHEITYRITNIVILCGHILFIIMEKTFKVYRLWLLEISNFFLSNCSKKLSYRDLKDLEDFLFVEKSFEDNFRLSKSRIL